MRPLPSVPLGPRLPAVLSVAVTCGHAVLSWRRSPGADTTPVSVRDVTAGTPWTVVADQVEETTWSSGPLPIGHRLQYRVLPRKGVHLALPDIASNVVSVTLPRLPGRPRPAVTPRGTGKVLVSWPAVARADSYVVGLQAAGASGLAGRGGRQRRPRLVLPGLRPGGVYSCG